MNPVEFSPLLLPYVFAIVILAGTSVFVFQRRNQALEARSLFILSLGVILWIGAYILEQISKEAQTQYFWSLWVRVGIVFSTLMIFEFSLRHSHRDHSLQKWHLALFILTSALILLLILQMFPWPLFGSWTLNNSAGSNLIAVLGMVYGFGISIWAVFILGKAYFEAPASLRWQGAALILGILLPVGLSFQTDVLGIEWIPNFDGATPSLLFSVLIFAWIIFRRNLFGFWPVAYETILKNIHDGVIILNLEGRVMMVNPAGEAVLGKAGKDVQGKPFRELTEQWSEDEIALEGMQLKPIEFSPVGKSHITYQVKITALYDKNGVSNGSVVLIYDISEWKRSQKQLTEMATIDFLTGINNRQNFIQLAEQELLRCVYNRQTCSVILLDVDHFKSVNDLHGHKVGDQVLKQIVDVCRRNIRQEDILGRYGGEEFIFLLPEIPQEEVLLVAERVRSAINQAAFKTPQGNITISVSLGVAVAEPNVFYMLDRLLEQADQALYISKNGGRNRVSVYSA